ncbi:MAG: LysE family translocator [Chloroflexi bacterium]|nr:LysE family translocator [Chloroflexota bacterium]
MTDSSTALWTAVGLGLSAALMPGPLQAFFLAQALRRGWRNVWFLAFTPLLSDGPIVALTLLVLSRLPLTWLNALRVLGSAYLLWLAWQLARSAARPEAQEDDARGRVRSLGQAVLINLVNPNPYIFWATVLGPPVVELARQDWRAGVAVVVLFYGSMVLGSLGLLALFSRAHRLSAYWRQRLTWLSAALLAGFALLLWVP